MKEILLVDPHINCFYIFKDFFSSLGIDDFEYNFFINTYCYGYFSESFIRSDFSEEETTLSSIKYKFSWNERYNFKFSSKKGERNFCEPWIKFWVEVVLCLSLLRG